jgi:UDP-N-acetylmuramoyl-L-alanyl-D-glutamate--2,6-diaminopimelate ligase
MTARLSDLLRANLDVDPVISGVTADSRQVRPGYLFAALPGAKVDGRAFMRPAVDAGAAAILAGEAHPELPVPVASAWDVRRAYALAAGAFYGAQPQTVVAVTGTNGKTSVAAFCRQIFDALGHKAASMGTLGVALSPRAGGQQILPPGLTTPDAADVASNLADLARRGVTHLCMEASSHGIDQRRLDAVRLTAAGFLNLTQDHLDYHGTMGAYRASKLRLFDTLLPREGTAVLNADSDAYGAFASASVMAGHGLMSVGAEGQGIRLLSRTPGANGQRLTLGFGGQTFQALLPLAGAFQASNALVAAGLCIASGEDAGEVFAAMEQIEGAPGRLQRVGSGPRGGEAYVDYAHTPDGLETVLKALRPHAKGRLMVVFGAGGDRDTTKRPLMGKAAADLADLVIVTDDNPRSEEPRAIRAAILAAAPGALDIGDRREAIETAVSQLREGDVLVVAGKGHEQGQIVAGVTHPFDDVAEVSAALGIRHG